MPPVCHSRLQSTKQRYTLSYLRPKDALVWCHRRVKRVRFRVVTGTRRAKHALRTYTTPSRVSDASSSCPSLPPLRLTCCLCETQTFFFRCLCPFAVVCALPSCKLSSAAGPDSIGSQLRLLLGSLESRVRAVGHRLPSSNFARRPQFTPPSPGACARHLGLRQALKSVRAV